MQGYSAAADRRPAKLVFQLVEIDEILVLEIEHRLEVALLVGQVIDGRLRFLDIAARGDSRSAAAGGLGRRRRSRLVGLQGGGDTAPDQQVARRRRDKPQGFQQSQISNRSCR